MLLREYIRAILEGDVVDMQHRLPVQLARGEQPDEQPKQFSPEEMYNQMWPEGRPEMGDEDWGEEGYGEVLDDLPDEAKPSHLSIAALDEWHTDLDKVMSTEEEVGQEDIENPARSDVDQKDPYSSANMGLKTTRGLQHPANMGSGPQSGRKPGGTRQG